MRRAASRVKPPRERPELLHDPRKLRRRRFAAGLSSAELAERAELSAPHITNLEKGRCGASAPALARIAGALGCEITDLLRDERDEQAAS